MIRIALRSLVHDRGKFIGSLAGVAFASTLIFAQVGLYAGYIATSSAIIRHMGGSLWVMARGTQVLENAELMSAGSRASIAAEPCVDQVRPLALTYATTRKGTYSTEFVQLIGIEPSNSALVPWTIRKGLPEDLRLPNRISVDRVEFKKLELPQNPLGVSIDLDNETLFVSMITEGIRSFTLAPLLFTDIKTVQRVRNFPAGSSFYWIVDLKNSKCQDEVIRSVERKNPELIVYPRETFEHITEKYWVEGSGAGSALGFNALLAMVVGTVIVGQTLYSITKEHLRELGTLKAVGSSNFELARFVLWQALFLAIFGGGLGLMSATLLEQAVASIGLPILLSTGVIALGLGSILLMCLIASIGSIRTVIVLEASAVFK